MTVMDVNYEQIVKSILKDNIFMIFKFDKLTSAFMVYGITSSPSPDLP